MTGGTEEAVIADLGTARRQDVKQEATKELDPGQGEAAHLLAAIVTKAEGHLMRIDALEAAVAQGDAKEIASQVGQDLLAPTGVLAVNHPVFLPDVGGDGGQQVDMGMIAKSSSPGMADGQATQTSAHVARVGGELL